MTPQERSSLVNSWREWLSWPIRTHWCWFETMQAIIFGVGVSVILILTFIAWWNQ
jgi:hypothetical protein